MTPPPADRAPEQQPENGTPLKRAETPSAAEHERSERAAAMDRQIDAMAARVASAHDNDGEREAATDEMIRWMVERAKLDPATRDGLAAYEQLKQLQTEQPADATDVILERLGIAHDAFIPNGDADTRSRALVAGQGSAAMFRAGLERSVATIIEDLRGVRSEPPKRRPTNYGRGQPPMSATA